MIYPIPLVTDLLENPDKMLLFCSLDMASGFWVVQMTPPQNAISALVTSLVLSNGYACRLG